MPSIPDPMPGLTLGGLDLLGYDKTGPFWFETYGDDHDMGNPVPIEREIESLLQDGAIEAVDSYGNREMTIRVVVCGEDSPGLAAGERALMSEVRRRNVLTWTPANILTGTGDPCVFDVVHSEPGFVFDDLLEVQALQRVYTLTIKALPHARSGNLRMDSLAAPAGVSPSVTLINNCSSLTGWTTVGTLGVTSTFTSSGGQVLRDAANTTGADADMLLQVTLSGLSINMSTTPYVRLDFTTGGSGRYGTQTTKVYLNGVVVSPAASNGSVAWYPFSGTLTSVKVTSTAAVSQYGKLFIHIADVSRSNLPQDASGTRQLFGSVDVAGSVRTEVTLSLSDATPAALGSVLVYTAPNMGPVAQPPLRAARVAGPTETTDTSVVSGKTSDLGTLHSFDIPANQLPDGPYLLMARVKHASTASYAVAWDAKARMGSSDVATIISGSTSVALTAGVWKIVSVGLMPLPGVTLGSSGVTRIDLSAPAGVILDEAWLFNMSAGAALSWVECGTASPSAGGSANRLWLDPASLEQPSASVAIGTATDRSDSFIPAIGSFSSWGAHEFAVPSMNIFAVTTNSVAMSVGWAYYPRFFTHVIEDS